MKRIDHLELGAVHSPPYFSVAIDFFSAKSEHGFNIEHSGDGRRRRSDSSAVFQLFQCGYGKVDRTVKSLFFQSADDLFPGNFFLCQVKGIHNGIFLCNGNPAIVYDVDFAAVFSRHQLRRVAGAAQTARHGNIDYLIETLPQNGIQLVDKKSDRRLGSTNLLSPFQVLTEFIFI